MAQILSMEAYYRNKLIHEVMLVKVEHRKTLDKMDNYIKKLHKDVEVLTAENEQIRAIIKDYEKVFKK